MFNSKFAPTIQIIDWSSSNNTLCVFSFHSLQKKKNGQPVLNMNEMSPCVCSVTDHRGCQNVVRTSVIHLAAPHVPLFCSCHILTSSVIYYWKDTRKYEIYLLLCYPYFEIQDPGLIFSERLLLFLLNSCNRWLLNHSFQMVSQQLEFQ